MNKNYKSINNSFREHNHLHAYLSPTMIEELLDLIDDLVDAVPPLESTTRKSKDDVRYWKSVACDE